MVTPTICSGIHSRALKIWVKRKKSDFKSEVNVGERWKLYGSWRQEILVKPNTSSAAPRELPYLYVYQNVPIRYDDGGEIMHRRLPQWLHDSLHTTMRYNVWSFCLNAMKTSWSMPHFKMSWWKNFLSWQNVFNVVILSTVFVIVEFLMRQRIMLWCPIDKHAHEALLPSSPDYR